MKICQHEIELALHAPSLITVPKDSKLLKVHSSKGEHIYAWFLENLETKETEQYEFYTIPTDWDMPETHPIGQGRVGYFNTIFVRDGEIVFHVFCSKTLIDNSTNK
jgi:hypothetical protein